jgi:hypothetical protein
MREQTKFVLAFVESSIIRYHKRFPGYYMAKSSKLTLSYAYDHQDQAKWITRNPEDDDTSNDRASNRPCWPCTIIAHIRAVMISTDRPSNDMWQSTTWANHKWTVLFGDIASASLNKVFKKRIPRCRDETDRRVLPLHHKHCLLNDGKPRHCDGSKQDGVIAKRARLSPSWSIAAN